MKVFVTGKIGKKLKRDLIDASHFYAEVLMGKRLSKNIVLDIEVVSAIEDNCQGDCDPESYGKNPRNFTIRLSKNGSDDPLKTLAHEMVHVKQYAKNELSYTYNSSLIAKKATKFSLEICWNGQVWKPKKKEHEYWDSPWELEAYAREPGLYHRFLELPKS